MATSDIKNLLDSIIDNTDNSYTGKCSEPSSIPENPRGGSHLPQTFDSGKFREKLSLYVLHDLVSAMMHDETKDLDDMIDSSIMRHITNDYHGTCYGYLCHSRDRLKSPLIGDIIQELEDKTAEVEKEVKDTKDEEGLKSTINIDEILKNVTNYEEFRDKLKDAVSDKVVKDVTDVVTKRNDAVVFDDLDDELDAKKADDINPENTNESVILRICGAIVTEAAIHKQPISTEEGFNKAVVEYCIDEMDYLLLKNAYNPVSSRYNL